VIVSPAGRALQEQLREVFIALRELDKHQPGEVAELVAAAVSTIRNFKPQAFLAAVAPTPNHGDRT